MDLAMSTLFHRLRKSCLKSEIIPPITYLLLL
jgi:hypothetical protein